MIRIKELNYKKAVCLLLFVLLSTTSLAANKKASDNRYKVKDGDTITVKVSSRELTRIAVYGDARLDKVWSADGIIDVKPDKKKGEVFIKPKLSAGKAFSFFVSDTLGGTYTIVAQQYDIPSQTVMLEPTGKALVTKEPNNVSTPYIKRIKSLFKAMAFNKNIRGYGYENTNETVWVWAETRINLKRVYTGHDFLGEVYTIQNVSDQKMTFHEQEFMDFGKRVQAVALERLSLDKGETTFLYVVRRSTLLDKE